MPKKRKPVGWDKAEHRMVLTPQSVAKATSIARVKARNGDTLETDIEKYNQRIRNAAEETKRFCDNRRAMDDYLLEKSIEQELAEVWD